VVHRSVVPSEIDTRWKDGESAIGWVRGWPSMGEKVGFKWVHAVEDQCAAIMLGESFSPELSNIRTNNSYVYTKF